MQASSNVVWARPGCGYTDTERCAKSIPERIQLGFGFLKNTGCHADDVLKETPRLGKVETGEAPEATRPAQDAHLISPNRFTARSIHSHLRLRQTLERRSEASPKVSRLRRHGD